MTAQFCRCWVCFYGQHVQSHSMLSSNLLATDSPDVRRDFKLCETSSSILIPRGGLASLSSRGRCRSALREEPRSRVSSSHLLGHHLYIYPRPAHAAPVSRMIGSLPLSVREVLEKIRVQLSFCRLEEVHQHSFESLPEDKCG